MALRTPGWSSLSLHLQSGGHGSMCRQGTQLYSWSRKWDSSSLLAQNVSTQVSTKNARNLLHELVFACSHLLTRQPQISYAILTEADWCAVRTAARCEAALLRAVGTWARA